MVEVGQDVTFTNNGKDASGYLAVPDRGRGPGVVVIQEWWGLVPHIRSVCDRLAKHGFVALAPDLYHGRTTSEPDEAGKLMMELDLERAARDMTAAVDYLIAHDAVTSAKIGVIGFCMGGGLALVLAAREGDKIGAAVPFYAVFKGETPDLSGITCPVVGHYGEEDASADPDAVRALEQQIRDQAGADVAFHLYPGADHAFFNDDRPEVYREDHARTAWERTTVFLNEQLQPEGIPPVP